MLVEVARFFDPEEAWCAESLLRARGFKTLVQNEHHLAVNPALRVALGGFPILCAPQEADAAALALLDAQAPLAEMCAEPDRNDSPALPRRKNWLFLVAALGVATAFIPIYRSKGEFAFQLLFVLAILSPPFVAFFLID